MPTSSATSGWRSRDVLRVTFLVVSVLLGFRLFWEAQDIFFLAFVGVLFGLTLSAAADKAQRFRIPRAISAPVILLLFLGFIAGMASFAAPQVSSQFQEVKEQLPKGVGKVRDWVQTKVGGVTHMLNDTTSRIAADSTPDSTGSDTLAAAATHPDTGERRQARDSAGGADAGSPANSPVKQLSPQMGSVGRAFFSFFSSTLRALGGVILIIFVTLFTAIDPELYQNGLIHLVPHRNRDRIKQVLQAAAISLRRWLVTQLIAMVAIGVVTGLAMWIIGIRGAVALGVLAGLLEFIPFLGPIASAVPAIAMGLLDSPEKAIWVALTFTVIQQAEGHLLIPLLMKDSLSLPPVMTILTQAVMATVFGFLGLLVAVPLLALVMVAVKLLYVEDVVGDNMEVAT